jgi:hypothetical protein
MRRSLQGKLLLPLYLYSAGSVGDSSLTAKVTEPLQGGSR